MQHGCPNVIGGPCRMLEDWGRKRRATRISSSVPPARATRRIGRKAARWHADTA